MPSTLAQRHSQLPAAPVCPAALHRLSGPSTDQPTGRRLQELQLPYLSTPRSSSTTLKGVTIAWRAGYRKYVPAFEAVPAAVSSGPSGRPVAAKFVSPDSVGERFGPSPKADLSAGRCPVVWSGGFMNGWSAGMWGAGRRARVSRLVSAARALQAGSVAESKGDAVGLLGDARRQQQGGQLSSSRWRSYRHRVALAGGNHDPGQEPAVGLVDVASDRDQIHEVGVKPFPTRSGSAVKLPAAARPTLPRGTPPAWIPSVGCGNGGSGTQTASARTFATAGARASSAPGYACR